MCKIECIYAFDTALYALYTVSYFVLLMLTSPDLAVDISRNLKKGEMGNFETFINVLKKGVERVLTIHYLYANNQFSSDNKVKYRLKFILKQSKFKLKFTDTVQ